MKSKTRVNIFLNILVVLVLAIVLAPFFIMITTALQPDADAIAFPPEIIPRNPTLQNFINIFNPNLFPFWRYFWNSFFIAMSSAVINLFVGVLAAYSFAKLDFFGKKFIQTSTLVVYMFSGILLIIPLFQIFSRIGIIDNPLSVIIACVVTTLPATLFSLTAYFRTIPDSIEESAMIDGLGVLRIIFLIVVPLSVPAIMASFAFVFMIAWNNFLFTTTFLHSPDNWTLIIGLNALFGAQVFAWGLIMAGSLLTAIPIIIIFACVERFISGGLIAGGVKG